MQNRLPELRCVRPSVRISDHKKYFDLIWCVGRPRPDMCTSVTLTRSKVKVQVTELLISTNCTFLCLPPPPFRCGAHNWWLIMILWDLVYSLAKPDFEFPSKKATMWVQASQNVDITVISKGIFPHCLRLESHGRHTDSPTWIVHADVT